MSNLNDTPEQGKRSTSDSHDPGEFERWKESWQRSVFQDRDLPISAKVVVTVITFHLNRDDRNAFPAIRTIARIAGLNRSTVLEAIDALERRGHLAVTRKFKSNGGKASSVYEPKWVPPRSEIPTRVVGNPDIPRSDIPTTPGRAVPAITSESEPLSIEPLTEPPTKIQSATHSDPPAAQAGLFDDHLDFRGGKDQKEDTRQGSKKASKQGPIKAHHAALFDKAVSAFGKHARAIVAKAIRGDILDETIEAAIEQVSEEGGNARDLATLLFGGGWHYTKAPPMLGATILQPPVPGSDWPPDFQERFWRQYPRRMDRPAAMAVLEAIRRKGEVSFADIELGAMRYAQAFEGQSLASCPSPWKWLEGARWEDDPDAITSKEKANNGWADAWIEDMARQRTGEVSDYARAMEKQRREFEEITSGLEPER
jgi:hypothetical protein